MNVNSAMSDMLNISIIINGKEILLSSSAISWQLEWNLEWTADKI